jgi:hypothetical protein
VTSSRPFKRCFREAWKSSRAALTFAAEAGRVAGSAQLGLELTQIVVNGHQRVGLAITRVAPKAPARPRVSPKTVTKSAFAKHEAAKYRRCVRQMPHESQTHRGYQEHADDRAQQGPISHIIAQ